MANETGRTVLITGGAGFIGSNLAARLLREKDTKVRIFDNFSRRGVEHNVEWLKAMKQVSSRLEVLDGDVRDSAEVKQAVKGVTEIYHFAAQVAVTTSVDDPQGDFDVNARGTLNVLEAARTSGRNPMLLFTSTNKVYGGLEATSVERNGTQYRATARDFKGVDESVPLDFHSPYGCSKGAADQYVRDYSRIYDLPTIVFRMSCICGPRQFGTEDQGWVAHFLYAVLAKQNINIYGDGFQVRDILHVEDLLDAMQAVRRNLKQTRGQIFNVGGGMTQAVSVIEMLQRIEQETGESFTCKYRVLRPGDQPLYITDFSKLTAATGWRPTRPVEQVLADIHAFWTANRELILQQRSVHAATETDLVEEEVA